MVRKDRYRVKNCFGGHENSKLIDGGQNMKKAIGLLFLVGVFLIGVGSQVLAENNKAEGITSETSMSFQSEESFFSNDNLILLAANQDKEDKDKDKDKGNKNKPDCSKFKEKTCRSNPHCCWHSNNSGPGYCRSCR